MRSCDATRFTAPPSCVESTAPATVFGCEPGCSHAMPTCRCSSSRSAAAIRSLMLPPSWMSALEQPLMTIERVQVLRRDGERIADLEAQPPVLAHDTVWSQKLTVHSSEDDRVDGHPLHRMLVQRLRHERLAGATTLRGAWGFHDDQPPRGDRFWQARRHAPVMTIAVDTHERIAEVFPSSRTSQSTAASSLSRPCPCALCPGLEELLDRPGDAARDHSLEERLMARSPSTS